MARHVRRLILWTTGVLLSLAALVMLGIAVLVWGIDPDVYRGRIERAASQALGRQVQLTGALRWRPGLNFQIESLGGHIANAAGFGPAPLASWQALRLGVALRPLRDRRLVIDRIEVQGLRVELSRSAAGVNWAFDSAASPSQEPGLQLEVGSIALRDGDIRLMDQIAGRAWSAQGVSLDVDLPAKLGQGVQVFSNLQLKARANGPPLQPEGVALQLQLPRLEVGGTMTTVDVPQWQLKWNDTDIGGAVRVDSTDALAATGTLRVSTPSLRGLLGSVSVPAPATRDAAAFGPFSLDTQFEAGGDAARFTGIQMKLDSTSLQGELQMPSLAPLALRFDLTADQLDVDKYLAPEDQPGTPLSLPLEQLKALDARGALVIRRATLAGAAARELRIDVD